MNNQIKVFLSSTFEDMQSEREHLVKKIFPAIKAECERRDVEFSVVDLRWGISEEQSSPGKIIDICLNEIDDSHPFFIGLVGNRYGTIWSREQLKGDEEILRRRPWVEPCLEDGMSITEMEMQYGVFDKTDEVHAFFYIKKTKWYRRGGETCGTKEERLLKQEKLSQLINKIEGHAAKGKVKAEHYDSESELGTIVYRQMMKMLDRLYPVIEDDNEMARLAITQKAWMRELCKTYYDDERLQYVEDLLANNYSSKFGWYDDRDSLCKHVFVCGKQGIGKSALLANLCNGKKNYFYIKACDEVSDDASLLELLKYMAEDAGLDYTKDSICCAIDDSEKLTIEAPDFKIWFKEQLPDNIRVIYSRSGNSESDQDNWNTLMPDEAGYTHYVWDYEVKELSAHEVSMFIKGILQNSAKELVIRKMEHIGNNPLFHTPGMLKLLLNEMVQYGSYEQIDSFTDNYLKCKERSEFFDCLLQRLEEDYDRARIQQLMGMLALIPIGLPSDDLRECLHVTRINWTVLNEVLSEYITHNMGMLVLDSKDMINAVQRRYLSDPIYVNDLRRIAISILRLERKRRQPTQKILFGTIMPLNKYSEIQDPFFKQINDVLVDQYIALDMKKELQCEYLEGLKFMQQCSSDYFSRIFAYIINDPDLLERFFSYKSVLLVHFVVGDESIGRLIGNQSKDIQNRLVKKINSLWLLPSSIKNKILDNISASDVDSTDYFCPDCNTIDLMSFVENKLLLIDDDSIPALYSQVGDLLESNEISDSSKLCLYSLIAAYCFFRLENRHVNNMEYYDALEYDKMDVIVPRTLLPFILEPSEDYAPLLNNLRKNVTLFNENAEQRIRAEIHLAKAEFLDAIGLSDAKKILISDTPDEVFITDEKLRIPIERLFAQYDVTIAGYNKYDLACQFAKLAYIKNRYNREYEAWTYSFAYKISETPEQKVSCLQKILKVIDDECASDYYFPDGDMWELQIPRKVMELLRQNDADPSILFSAMLTYANAYRQSRKFHEAIACTDEAYSYFDANRVKICNEAWFEFAYAHALDNIWKKMSDKYGAMHLLDKAYTHYGKAMNLYPENEMDWVNAHLNRNRVLVMMCQTYAYKPKERDFDLALSGYKETLSLLRDKFESEYYEFTKDYCFLLLSANRVEEALLMAKENNRCILYPDDKAFIENLNEDAEQSQTQMGKILYKDILDALDSYKYIREEHVWSPWFFVNPINAYNEITLVRDYKERIKGRIYYTYQLLVECAKKNQPIDYTEEYAKPKKKWDWEVVRLTILLFNDLLIEEAQAQNDAYNEAMRYIVTLYKECKNKKWFTLAPIFPVVMLMSKIAMKEKHQNRPVDALIWFQDIYKKLVEETGEQSDYVEFDLLIPFLSIQRFMEDDSSEYGGLRPFFDFIAMAGVGRGNLRRNFRDTILRQWNNQMEKEEPEVVKKYAYKFIELHKETSFVNDEAIEILIECLLNENAKEELIEVVDYCVNNFRDSIWVTQSLWNITTAMLEWSEEERLLTWLGVMREDCDKLLAEDDGNFTRIPLLQITSAKVRALNNQERYVEAYEYAMHNRIEFETFIRYFNDSFCTLYYLPEWFFFFHSGKAALRSGNLYEAMDLFTKDAEIIDKIQDALNNEMTVEETYTQEDIDTYKIDNGCMMATCMLKQGNIEDGKHHFAERVEPLLTDADADNCNVKLYQEELAKLSR